MADCREKKVVVAGAAGRMGRIICKLVQENENFIFAGGLEKPSSPAAGRRADEVIEGLEGEEKIYTDPQQAFSGADLLIDFTRPEATVEFLQAAARSGLAVVTGTTGLSPEQEETVRSVAEEIPVVKAANMSMGINLLLNLVRTTTGCLEDFDVEIMEMHHRFKEDAPSGTARMLGEAAAEERNREFEEVKKSGRDGFEGERTDEEIGVSALRGGDVVGEHTVIFAGMGERIELTHRASSRRTFAAGALKAGEFIVRKEKGLYDMQDVLGLA